MFFKVYCSEYFDRAVKVLSLKCSTEGGALNLYSDHLIPTKEHIVLTHVNTPYSKVNTKAARTLSK